MTEKNYPEEIYTTRDGGAMTQKQRQNHSGKARRRAYDLGYQAGLTAADPLVGWSNLTEAIQAGEPIDWERLDGLEAKCVHPELGTLTYRLERDDTCPPEVYSGWFKADIDAVWYIAFRRSWRGSRGWSLYIKGELPLVKPTADQLKPGTCFRARYKKGVSTCIYTKAQVLQVPGGDRVFCFSRELTNVLGVYDPADLEVLEVYGNGTFQKQEAQK